MHIKKKKLTCNRLAILSSLSESYMMLPFVVFSSLLSTEKPAVSFFVPVVIIYSIERACVIGLRGFGEIANPYRIMKSGLILASFGAILMVLSYLYRPLLALSALLIGAGLAPTRAMFLSIYIRVTEQDPSLKKGKGIGTVLYLLIMLLAMSLGKCRLPIIPVLFLLYILISLCILLGFDGDALFDRRKAFNAEKRSPLYFVFGILALLSLLILRQYQYSGISVLMWLIPAAVIIFIALDMHRHRRYMFYSFRTYWIGAVKSFVMLFSLFYHASTGNASMSMQTYLAIALSGMLSGPVSRIRIRQLSESDLSGSCMLISAVLTFLLTLPSRYINLAGILLCGIFSNIALSEMTAAFMKDERYVPEERPLVKLRIQMTGSILEQIVLFLIIYLIGEFGIHRNLLESYATGIPDPGISLLLRTAGITCCSLLLLGAVLIVFAAGRQRHDPGNGIAAVTDN